ncbi:MAG: histidine kinase, partial [Henriciella sp.]|nr:histidine kinase [Henriciella sp.]
GSDYDLSPRGERVVKVMAQLAERVPDIIGPAAQASERLGLPRSFLWRSAATQARLLKNIHDSARTVTP